MKRKRIAVWGSTGSIGRQTLDVIQRHPEKFKVSILTAHSNTERLFDQARTFRPEWAVITGSRETRAWKETFASIGVNLLQGREGFLEIAGMGEEDLVVNALVGSVGLEATMKALETGSTIALANKEVLVMAGDLVMQKARQKRVRVLPVDSEHSAIFQCLRGEKSSAVQKILLTASGGPFLRRKRTDFKRITVQEALAHPNWTMGKKVTIDSATLMNKGLEVIEARWLFGIDGTKIEVVIHPQSIIHSMVEFMDGSVKAQLGIPDMRIPISYALTYPGRIPESIGTVDFKHALTMDFEPPDLAKFPALRLAYEALEAGGTVPAVLNGADEAAVDLFLSGKIRFSQIPEVIESALCDHEAVGHPGLEEILQANQWAKESVRTRVKNHINKR